MSLQPGMRLLQRYEIVQLLGTGGMGTVYKAWDHDNELPCAIKYLSLHTADAEQQFAVEADLLTRLRSAHVPRFYAYLPALPFPGQALVMEYVEGIDLETQLAQQGMLDERTAFGYILQVLEALIHLHNQPQSIIHRDVKPANIRIDRHGNAWLLDLGIGKRVGTATARGALAATVAYAPPEQLQSAPTDQRSDLYAVGATLYHLVTGHSAATALERIAGVPLEPPRALRPQISAAGEQIVLRALQMTMAQRYTSAEQMHDAIERFLDPQVEQRHDAAQRLQRKISWNMQQVISSVHVLPQQQAVYGSVDPPLPPALDQAYGGWPLYRHQAESLERVRKGRDIVVVTGTASGKSMCYNLPILERCMADPRAHALYLFPIKALINDQAHILEQLINKIAAPDLSVARLHGDLEQNERQMLRRRPPRLALSNPEFVHWMLAFHPSWRLLFSRLQFIVLDEVHVYRGVFGSHVAQFMRRLLRVCAYYGAHPQIICCSATVANPDELAERLTGRRPHVIDRDGAARMRRHVVFWKPLQIGANERRAADDDAVLVTNRAVKEDKQVITFGRARQQVEHMLVSAREAAPDFGYAPSVFGAYRGGYTRKDREQIEQDLRNSRLKGVFSTSALEMGIDIGGLQMSVLTGYPGSHMSFWQQAGRAGRRGEDAHVVLVGAPNPLDQYYLSNPGDLLYGPSEEAAVDLRNPYIAEPHVLCMARERPIQQAEVAQFPIEVQECLDMLLRKGLLIAQQDAMGRVEYVYRDSDLPHRLVNMRSTKGATYRILDRRLPDPLLGTIEIPTLYREAHEQAIYYHMGQAHRVIALDHQRREILVVPEQRNHMTRAVGTKAVVDTQTLNRLDLHPLGMPALCSFGHIQVTERITGYKEYQRRPQRKIADLQLPTSYQYDFETRGFWLDIDEVLQKELDQLVTPGMQNRARRPKTPNDPNMGAEDDTLGAALHGLEHLLLALVPTVALCDRRDLGCHHTAHFGENGIARVYIYDYHYGGIGLAERAYRQIPRVLQRAYDVVTQCECEDGCPYCIQANWCYEENECLDKDATIYLLGRLLNRPTAVARPPSIAPANQP